MIAVLIPSRSRPEQLSKAVESIHITSTALVVCYIDRDQEELYKSVAFEFSVLYDNKPGVMSTPVSGPRCGVVFVIGERRGPLASVNRMAQLVTATNGGITARYGPSSGMVYMTDDSTVSPIGWELWLESVFHRTPIGIVSAHHADDDTTIVNFPAMSSAMHEKLGWFGPPEMHAWYWDTALEIIGDAVGLTYAKSSELRFDHSNRLPNEPGKVTTCEDAVAFHSWCLTGRRQAIQRVRA